MHSERYFLQSSYLLYKQETLLLGLQSLLLQPACNAQHRQQKPANISLLESRSLLQTAILVFPWPIVCSRLSNNINILAKNIARPPTEGHARPPGWIRNCDSGVSVCVSHCFQRHVVGQRVVSDISAVRSCCSICNRCSESNNANVLLQLPTASLLHIG